MHGSYESEQPQSLSQRKSTENNNKSTDSSGDNDYVRKPIADTLHTFLGHIHQQHQLQQHADSLLAKNWLKSESVPTGGGISGIGGAANAGGMAALGSLGATGLSAAAGLGGPALNGLPNFFLPFSAAQIPFPNFLSQASLFHVKDSV